jgi:hypothetical protein
MHARHSSGDEKGDDVFHHQRCFFEQKKKISQKKMKLVFDDQFLYASCIFCSESIST